MVYKFEAAQESAGGFGVKESLRIQSVLGTAKAERLSPRADGIENGSEQKMFYRVPEELVQEYPALKQAKKLLTDAGADDVRFVSGSIRIRTAGGREMSVQGVTQGTTVWLTIDAKDGVVKTAAHEAMHLRLEAEAGLRERMIDAMGLSREQRDKLARKYCEAYEGCYGREDLIPYLDEIACDAYAGINRMGLGADKLQNAVRTAADRAESQRTKKPAQTRGPPERYAIGKTTENKPFVEVERDILAGVPEEDWVKTIKENLKKKFPDGIAVGNNNIRINQQSMREMTFSGYMQWLYNNDPKLRADKLRATDNADEILQATTSWVNEGLNHPRKDKIADFARGNVLLRVGGNDYTAEVVVGTRGSGSMMLYDILNLQPTSFTKKETDAAKAENPSPGTNRNTASVSANNIRRSGQKSQGKFSPAASPKENDKTALAYFGKTYKWNETGYVLLDGSRLDFSGRHEGDPGGYRSDYYAKMARAFLMDRDGGEAEKKIEAYDRCVAKG